MTSRLIGTWQAILSFEAGRSLHFRLYDDLRYIVVFAANNRAAPARTKQTWQSVLVGMVLESDSVLRCCYKIGGPTYTRGIHFEGECLVLTATIPATEAELNPSPQLFHYQRIATAELPAGVEEVFDREFAREWT